MTLVTDSSTIDCQKKITYKSDSEEVKSVMTPKIHKTAKICPEK